MRGSRFAFYTERCLARTKKLWVLLSFSFGESKNGLVILNYKSEKTGLRFDATCSPRLWILFGFKHLFSEFSKKKSHKKLNNNNTKNFWLHTSPLAGGLSSGICTSGYTFSMYHLKLLQPSLSRSLTLALMSPYSMFRACGFLL